VKKTPTYIFLDEAGNLDFSSSGTRFFVLGALITGRPSGLYADLAHLKYELIEQGINIEYFHAAEDSQIVRDRVFEVIQRNLKDMRFDTLIVEKRKTGPALQHEEKFYPRMLGYLLRFVIEHVIKDVHEVIVFTDRLPIQRKRKAIEKAVKQTLAAMLPRGVPYRVYHHDSKSNFGLQVADYLTWSVYRKWDRSDSRSFELVKVCIKTQFDIFRTGTTSYY
jgi:hypothetical protein